MLIIPCSCSSQPPCCALSVDIHSLPLTVLQVLVLESKAGYTIIQLSFRTGLEHLKGFTLKRQNICHLLSVPFLKTHLVWVLKLPRIERGDFLKQKQTEHFVCTC